MADTTEVHRWRPVHGGDAWVRATDYDALAAKLAEVEEMKRLLAMDKINLRGELAGVQGRLAAANDLLAEVEALVEAANGVVNEYYNQVHGPVIYNIKNLDAALSALEGTNDQN